ncbi:MAG: phosphatidate cytidylyltransferase [Proteobacteria bacterium]|nr:phosphatidate cytidylyltransferase [Pseudomonadota bacterium]
MQLSPHSIRLATACLVLALPAAALFFGGPVLFFMLALFSGLTLWEFYSLFWPGKRRFQTKIIGQLLSFGLLVALAQQNTTWSVLALLVAFWIGNLAFLSEFSKNGEQASYLDGLVFFAGLMYVPLALHFFLSMNPMECILVLAAVIFSDTAAFYAGTLWGKAKIWPQVSPKKSWVGSFGGLIACTAVTTGLGALCGNAPWWAYIYLGIFLNLAAQFGDFFESAIKRKLGIKDSGDILPGHGGLMDRLDSLLLALPAYAIALAIFPELILRPGFTQLLSGASLP